jgi:pantetheine-phosphate adenylyltransferase
MSALKGKKIAVYAGSFDPITFGHVDIVRRACKVFDELHVVLAVNPTKKYTFSVEENVRMVTEALKQFPEVKVVAHDGLLINYAQEVGAQALVRGLRALSDFDYEFHMATINQDLCSEIETLFITAGAKYFYINSTTIKEMAKYGADISGYVPKVVAQTLARTKR